MTEPMKWEEERDIADSIRKDWTDSWKEFLRDECFDLEKYKEGKYDKKIADFSINKAVSLLTKQKEEWRERGKGMKHEITERKIHDGMSLTYPYREGYNQGIDDFSALLETKK